MCYFTAYSRYFKYKLSDRFIHLLNWLTNIVDLVFINMYVAEHRLQHSLIWFLRVIIITILNLFSSRNGHIDCYLLHYLFCASSVQIFFRVKNAMYVLVFYIRRSFVSCNFSLYLQFVFRFFPCSVPVFCYQMISQINYSFSYRWYI